MEKIIIINTGSSNILSLKRAVEEFNKNVIVSDDPQTILSAKEPKTKEEIETSKDFSQMVLQAVKDEDYKMGLQIQSNIFKLESHNFVYGKNEPAVQNYHNWIDKFMNKEGSNW